MTQPALFEPLTVRGITFRNRIWVPAMCQYTVTERDGVPTEWHLVHLGAFARGGAGLVMSEATAVVPEGRISPHDTGIWNDAQRDAWKPITAFIRSQGAVAGIQLAHAGRKASIYPDWGDPMSGKGTAPESEGGWPTVAPSAIAFEGYAETAEMTTEEIDVLVTSWTEAAVRAVDAGFQALEIHAAHGYLLHQFLSPKSNARTDEYGGALENRARLVVRIVAAIRAAVGDAPLIFVRFSATDWVDDGFNEEECSIVADWCQRAGADVFDISSGGNVVGVTIPLSPGYQVPLAEFVRSHGHVMASAVGLITTPELANAIVAEGRADAVMVGREHLRDPHFALRAAVALEAEIDYWPSQYLRARPKRKA
jgi:2,4-dienoyl-CoA reductase-like NADH-dependent reductase (Old Yellow Enzyme family)